MKPKSSPGPTGGALLIVTEPGSGLDTEKCGHLVILETTTRYVRLDPFAVKHKLRNGTLAGFGDYLISRAGHFFNVDFLVVDLVLRKPAFGSVAIAAPGS